MTADQTSQKLRLDEKMIEYKASVDSLQDLLYKIYRIRKEIMVLCESLDIEIALEEIVNEKEQ